MSLHYVTPPLGTNDRGVIQPGESLPCDNVTTNEKLLNVGGLNRNGVMARALVPAIFPLRWSEFVFHAFEQSFATSL